MAKKKAPADPDKALREFVAELQESGTIALTAKQRSGIFVQAMDRGYAAECSNPNPPKKAPKNPKTFVQITHAGAAWLIEQLSAKDALRGFQQQLQAQSESLKNQSAVASDVPARLESLSAELERLRHEVRESLEHRQRELQQLASSLDAMQAIAAKSIREIEQFAQPAPTAAASSPTPIAAAPTANLEQAVVEFVEEYWRDHGRGCSVVELKRHLDAIHSLTVGTFHDSLRTLHRAGRISLTNWARMLTEIPEPELALFLADKVMYYVSPRDRSI